MTKFFILSDLYTNGYQPILLIAISIFSVSCGIYVIVSKNPIVSVLFLIGLFFGIASYLMALGLNFIGLSYLLVYVGAVSILFLFILMLINVRISELVTDNSNSLILALLLGLFILAPIYTRGNTHDILNRTNVYLSQDTVYNESSGLIQDIIQWLDSILQSLLPSYVSEGINTDYIYYVTSKLWDGTLAEVSHITSIGNVIYTNNLLWLILTSIILLLAMVGSIVITIKRAK